MGNTNAVGGEICLVSDRPALSLRKQVCDLGDAQVVVVAEPAKDLPMPEKACQILPSIHDVMFQPLLFPLLGWKYEGKWSVATAPDGGGCPHQSGS